MTQSTHETALELAKRTAVEIEDDKSGQPCWALPKEKMLAFAQSLIALNEECEGLKLEWVRHIKQCKDWKWEYENLCKFTTDYEQQRDALKSRLERAEGVLREIHHEATAIHGQNINRARDNITDWIDAYFSSAAEKMEEAK